MVIPPKLTKKQKKGLAFRERKRNGSSNGLVHTAHNDVPVLEDQDAHDTQVIHMEMEAMVDKKERSKSEVTTNNEKVKGKKKDNAKEEGSKIERTKKRKRVSSIDLDVDKANEGEEIVKRQKVVEDTGQKELTKLSPVKQRFILFVGNLKYTTSLETIQSHFSRCDPPPTIRLLTARPSSSGTSSKYKSKGCAFLEFSHRNALQQALKLHQSNLDGRMINVELTAGGGGKGEKRLAKLKNRNKVLLGQREHTKKTASDEATSLAMFNRPQRYSSTSGVDQVPLTRRTWTVGEDANTQSRQKRRPRGKSWGTGVNAIPVG